MKNEEFGNEMDEQIVGASSLKLSIAAYDDLQELKSKILLFEQEVEAMAANSEWLINILSCFEQKMNPDEYEIIPFDVWRFQLPYDQDQSIRERQDLTLPNYHIELENRRLRLEIFHLTDEILAYRKKVAQNELEVDLKGHHLNAVVDYTCWLRDKHNLEYEISELNGVLRDLEQEITVLELLIYANEYDEKECELILRLRAEDLAFQLKDMPNQYEKFVRLFIRPHRGNPRILPMHSTQLAHRRFQICITEMNKIISVQNGVLHYFKQIINKMVEKIVSTDESRERIGEPSGANMSDSEFDLDMDDLKYYFCIYIEAHDITYQTNMAILIGCTLDLCERDMHKVIQAHRVLRMSVPIQPPPSHEHEFNDGVVAALPSGFMASVGVWSAPSVSPGVEEIEL